MKTATQDRMTVSHAGLAEVEGALLRYFIQYNVEFEIEQTISCFKFYCYPCKELTEDEREHIKHIELAIKDLNLENYKILKDERHNALCLSVASKDVTIVNVPPTPSMHNSKKKGGKKNERHKVRS